MEKQNEKSDGGEQVFGIGTNFWRYTSDRVFDLTRQTVATTSPSIYLKTTTHPIIIDPLRSALIIIDMQNFFLHPSIRTHQTGLAACNQLLNHAIPAARKANIQIIWLNWGLTDEDIESVPPGLKCIFGFDRIVESSKHPEKTPRKLYRGLGSDMGEIILSSGEKINAGKLLMRHNWNTQLYDPLQKSYTDSLATERPDQWFHKNRTSGMWTDNSPILSYLHERQITTLFFAGVNTDQCVSGTLQDAFNKGFDCLLLRDACGTTSPIFAQQTIEYNCTGGSGFVIDCETFTKCIDTLL